jgi:thiol-disulfide isomerase/thioredoxin
MLTNNGNAGISNFDYVVRTGDAISDEQHVELEEPFNILGGKTEATVILQADADFTRADKQLVITRVNGQPNEEADKAVSEGTLITLAQASTRRTLIEEYTGTWCGYCPRGTVGLELLQEEFADDIAIVSVHTDDPMTILGYQPMYENVREYPSAYFNRAYGVDPYAGTIEQPRGSRFDVLWQQSLPTEASLDIEARWTNEQQTRIAVTSKMRFQYHSDTAPYGVAYVLVEDGLQCDTTGWEQRNFFFYFKDQGDYQPGTQMGDDFKDYLNVDTEYMKGVVYNDVAVAAYGITEGLANSVKAPLAVDEEKTHSYTISVASNTLIQDKQQLRVVAFIIDRVNGRVVNAAVAPVSSGADGVEPVHVSMDSDDVTARSYDLQGRQLSSNHQSRGLRIVRQADRSVVKLLVRP